MRELGFHAKKNCSDRGQFYMTGCEANFLFRNMRSNVSGHLPHTKDSKPKKKKKGKLKGKPGKPTEVSPSPPRPFLDH